MTPVHCTDLRTWNRFAERTFGDIAVASAEARFEADLAARDWPGVRLVQVDSPAAQVRGGRGGRPGWYLLYNEFGRCALQQDGRRAALDAGELSLLRADRPYEIAFDQPNRMTIAALPLLEGPPALQRRLVLRHGRDESALVGALLRRLAQLDDAAARGLDAQALRAALCDLLLLARPVATPGASEAALPGRQAGQLMHIAALVQRELASPELDGRLIAAELGLSLRAVQLLFERQGTTASAYILAQRLQHAASVLRERPAQRIADLALEAGFGDLSYFCRAFRRRYGCTAREWRRPN